MIIENPYHRRKVKAILQENSRLKAELAEFSGLGGEVAQLKEINFLKGQVAELKKKIQGYKVQNSRLRKLSRS